MRLEFRRKHISSVNWIVGGLLLLRVCVGQVLDSDFSRPSPGKTVYEPTWAGRCPAGAKCGAPERSYIDAVFIHIDTERSPYTDFDLEDRAAGDVLRAFSGIAKSALAGITDTTAIGWLDSQDAICRAHQNKPSLVLSRPYFEDVEYCFRLIKGPPGTSYRLFRLQTEVSVTVAINPESGYREPTRQEMTPYEELIVKKREEIRVQLGKSARDAGWHVVDNIDIDIDGREGKR